MKYARESDKSVSHMNGDLFLEVDSFLNLFDEISFTKTSTA